MTDPIEIAWPRGGLNETLASDKQPPQTTSDAANVGNVDPITGRDMGAKRCGRTRQHPDKLSFTEKVADLGSVTFTQKTVDYTQDEGVLWETGIFPCYWIEVDADGNAYALTGPAAITKYSADGEEIYTFPVPVPSGATVGTLDVDEGANVFCGVSGTRSIAPAGTLGSPEPGNGLILGDKEDARLYKLQHAFRNNDDETEPELEVAWTLTRDTADPGPTLRGLVTFVRVKLGKLYTLQQDNEQWRTWLVVYDLIHAGIPIEVLARDDIPYPASMLDVDPKGRIVISSENFVKRGMNPAYPESAAAFVGWDPAKDIDMDVLSGDDKHQIFTHFKLEAKYLTTTGGLEPEDGSQVIEWRDASGHGRVMKFASASGKKSALYRAKGLGGKPELYFDGATHLYVTGTSPSGDADFRDAQRGIFPAYRDPDDPERSSQYAVVALMRPEPKEDTAVPALTNQFPVWDYGVENSTLSDHSALTLNRKASDTLALAANNETGAVSWFMRADAADKGEGTASGLMPAYIAPSVLNPSLPFNNKANALLVTLIACNGVDPGITEDFTRSLMRVWGLPIDRFMQETDANYSLAGQFLGGSAHTDFSTLAPLYRGGISEIIVLDRKNLDKVGPDSVVTHPAQPDSAFGNMVGQVTILNEGTGGTNITGNLTFFSGGFITPASGTWTSANGKITSINITSTGSGYGTRPVVVATGYTGAGAVLQAGMDFAPGTKASPTVLEKIEGYIAWKHGMATFLASMGSYQVNRVNSSGTAGTYRWHSSHPYFYAVPFAPFIDDQGPPENENTFKLYKLTHRGEVLTYLDPSGKILDVLSHELNGIGLGCRFNHDGTLIYTAGNTNGSDGSSLVVAANQAALRKIVVKDDDTLGWTVLDGGGAVFAPLRMSGPRCGLKVDAADNVYVPCNAPIDVLDSFSLAVVSPLGVLIHGFSSGLGITNQGTFCVALPRAIEKADLEPVTPDYGGDLTHDIVEHVWIAGRTDDYTYVDLLTPQAVRKYGLVAARPNDNPPRSRVDLGVSRGTVVRFDQAVLSTPSGGSSILGTGYVHSVSAFEKFYWTDGAVDFVYDPKTDQVREWTAKRGTMPPRCRIIELWRGRLVRAGDQELPGAIHMSRVFEPDDWDTHPPVPTVDQACEFSGTQVGNLPDRVTGFVPFADDLALMGGDHTLWRLDGDPLFGGRLSNVSTSIGMAFGRAWCIDGQSRIWFIDNNGQLQMMTSPRGLPEGASENKIARRLQAIDFSRYYMRLAYDRNRQGLWIMPLPFGALEDEQIETFFYDMRTGSFWPHFIDALDSQVTALHVIDGDEPQDRRVLFGHGNGYVTYADDQALRDDGIPIRSRVLLGPYKSRGSGREIRTIRLGMVLGSNQGGITWNLYASATPDDKGTIKRSGTFGPGNNQMPSAKTLGAYFWIEILATTAHARFSFEKAWLTYEVAGDRQKVRP